MANAETYTSPENGALFLQECFGLQPVYLGCHDLGDIVDDRGDRTIVQCFENGEYKTINTTRNAPSLQSTDLTTFLGKVQDYLEFFGDNNRTGKLFVMMYNCGKPDMSNYERAFILDDFNVNTGTYSNLVMRSEGNASEVSFSVSYSPTITKIFNPEIAAVAVTETEDINDIVMYDLDCATACPDECTYGVMVANGDAVSSPAVSANVLVTSDGAGTWAVTSTDPFDGGEDISSVIVVPMGTDVRFIVARGTTDGSNPMEVALSDDTGATWVNVDVGSTNGEYAPYGNSLFAIDKNNIWIGGDSGNIYKSTNGGVTWTIESTPTVQPIYSIDFATSLRGVAGGANNALLKTIDGGSTWSALTAPVARASDTINAVVQYDASTIFIGYSTGYVYISTDSGVTWTQQTFSGSGVASSSVNDLFFVGSVGFMVYENAANLSSVFRTLDGGANWEEFSTPTNSGINAIYACNPNLAFMAGDAHSGTSFVAKMST